MTTASPEDARSSETQRIVGRLGAHLRGGGWRAVRVLFGFVYLQQLWRLVAWLFGRRTRVEVELGEAALRVRAVSSLLGVRTGEREEAVPLQAVARVGAARFSAGTFMWAGGSLFAGSAVLAALFGFRGRVGFGTSLLLAALAFLLLGLALDMGAYALAQVIAARGRGRVEIEGLDGRRLIVCGVPWEEARRFVDETARRLPKAPQR